VSLVCSCLSCPAHGKPVDPPSECPFYPSPSITDAQWAALEPLLPPLGNTAGRGGQPEKYPRRMILDAILPGAGRDRLAADAQRFPARDDRLRRLPPLGQTGAWQRIHDALRDLVRLHAGRDPLPTAAIIDSQTVRDSDTVPTANAGYDAGKKPKDANDTSPWTRSAWYSRSW
jgi:transposase